MKWKDFVWVVAGTLAIALAVIIAVTVHAICERIDILTAPPVVRSGWSTGDVDGQ